MDHHPHPILIPSRASSPVMSPIRTRKSLSRENSLSLAETESTNTLIITQLPAEVFEPRWLDAIRAVFERHGEIHTWAPIRFLRRAIVTFWAPHHAEAAKRQLDGLVLPSAPPAKIRVYRGAHTPIRTHNASSPTDPSNPDPFYLAPPRLEKNFLISPPGSPPVGWEPAAEEPPNAAPLAADLIAALSKLQISQQRSRRRKSSGQTTEIVYEGTPMTDGVGIVVSVEDFGGSPEGSEDEEGEDEEGDVWMRESKPRMRIAPTALPPMVRSS